MFNDFIATLVASVIALSGAVAHDASQLSERIGDLLFPVAETSIGYDRVPDRPRTIQGVVLGENTTPVTPQGTVVTQPVIEHVRETVHTVSGITEEMLEARLAATTRDFTNSLLLLSNTSQRQDVIVSDSIGDVLGGTLQGLTVVDSSWTGGTITNATITGGAINTNTLSGVISITNGGTATTTAPAYGQLLLGNNSGGYDLVSTSSLGIVGSGSQWTTSGSDLYFATGKVGIGTTTPSARLSIAAAAASDAPLVLSEASGQTAPLLTLRGSTALPLFQRPTTSSLNAVNWSHIVNQNPYTDGSGIGGENYNNEVTALGWNLSNTVGVAATAGTAAFWDNWEYKFNVGGKYMNERHMESVDTGGTRHRFFSFAVPHDGGTGSSHMLAVDDIAWKSFDASVTPIQWDLKDGAAYFGNSSGAGFTLNFNKNNVPVLQQRNAADSAFLSLPYYNASNQLVLGGQIVHSASAPTTSTEGVSLNFSGTPANASTALGVNYPATTNATLTGLGAYGSTNWDWILDVRNANTSSGAGSVLWLRTGGAGGTPYARYSRNDGTEAWSTGRNSSGDFEIAGYSPGTGTVVRINKTTLNLGIGTSTPWRKLSVTGTVGFDGLTGSTGAGSLCLDSNKQVVYNSASDNCLSSTRATKHDINPLVVDALEQVLALQPVSFIYNDGDGRVRYGFIAEDTANVDAHLATYDASSTVSGIDDRSIIAILVGAIKDLYARTQEYFARTERLEERVSALEAQLSSSAAAGAPSVGTSEAPDGPSASGGSPDTDTATSTTPSALETSVANDNEPVVADDARATEPEDQLAEQPELKSANDNEPADLPATGTE